MQDQVPGGLAELTSAEISEAPDPSGVDAQAPPDLFAPLAGRICLSSILPALLRQPGRIVYQLHQPGCAKRVGGRLAVFAVVCLAIYGVIVGSFSGCDQFWAAPLKIAAGSLLTAAICLPSLYVFACLGGANERLRLDSLAGLLMAAVALCALLLVSFAPIAWVFSQSTDSIALIATLHLLFWAIGLAFGLKLITISARFLGIIDREYLALWMIVFVLVSLQMMTALRPIVGRADQFFPTEKQFFLSHWLQILTAAR